MRLSYVSDDPVMPSEAENAIVQRIKERRGGQLIALDKTLLISPPIADGWNSFFGAIRTQTSIASSLRELAMCRVAVLNHAMYEWDHHLPILMATGVLSKAAIALLKDPEAIAAHGAFEGLDERHTAVWAYTDAMTRGCVVPQLVFEQLRQLFSEREIMEITSTIAGYNCVSRILVALDVGEMAEKYSINME